MNKYAYISKIFLLAAFATMPFSAHAAPVISTAPANVTNGQSATISGSGFGLKTTATPLLWDNFEAQQASMPLYGSNPIVGSSTWSRYISDYTQSYVTDAGGHAESKSVHLLYETSNINGAMVNFTGASQVYLTWWGYQNLADSIDPNTDIRTSGVNRKWFYLYGASAPTMNIPSGQDGWSGVWDNISANQCQSTPALLPTNGNVTFADTHKTWRRYEAYLKMESATCATDGISAWWMDGVLQKYLTNYTYLASTANPLTDRWNTLNLGVMWGGYANFTPRPYARIDDVYLDNTLARVEICVGSTWETRGICEIQRPVSWADTSLDIIVNQGAFANSSTQHLYIIDAVGDVNANGRDITLGTGGDTTAPNNPSGQYIPILR